MAKILNLYKDDQLLASEEVTGDSTKVVIDNLTPDTSYPKGTYQVSFQNDTGESSKVDVPEFKTLASTEPEEPEEE